MIFGRFFVSSGRGDLVLWVPPDDVPEMGMLAACSDRPPVLSGGGQHWDDRGRLVEFTNAVITLLMELPQEPWLHDAGNARPFFWELIGPQSLWRRAYKQERSRSPRSPMHS